MQDNLLCKLINNKISLNDYLKNINKKNNYEFILYTDNILEGITLLNLISENQNFFKFYAVIYEPIDQPIYVFKENDKFISIKICGNFNNWSLPNQVKKLISFIDLPDYLIYSINNKDESLIAINPTMPNPLTTNYDQSLDCILQKSVRIRID